MLMLEKYMAKHSEIPSGLPIFAKTGIGKINEVSIIENIYPNPASDKISLTMKSKGNVTLQILDATGKTIINQNISVNADGTTVTLPVSDLTRGLYFLVIRDQNGNIASRQFIKN